MSFFRLFNFIYKLFSKRGLKSLIFTFLVFAFVFVCLFLSGVNQAYAYSDYTLNYSSLDNTNLVITLDNSDGYFDDYLYCILFKDTSGNNGFVLSKSIMYIDNTNVNTQYYNGIKNVDGSNMIKLSGLGSTYTTYTLSSSDVGSFLSFSNFQDISIYSNICNYVVYSDDSLSTSSSINVNSAIYSNDGSSGGGSSSGDYSNVLGHIDSQVTSTNTIVENIDNTTQSIDNRVHQIQIILQNQNQNQVTNAIYDTSLSTQNQIYNTSKETQNLILQGQNQSQSNFNYLTNTSSYDQNSVVIDTSFNDITDVNGVDNFVVTIYNKILTYFQTLKSQGDDGFHYVLEIPLPFTNKVLNISSEPIQNFYSQHYALSTLITMFWYFIFGIYIFRIAWSMWISAVNGDIVRNTEGFVGKMDDFSLIRYFMM